MPTAAMAAECSVLSFMFGGGLCFPLLEVMFTWALVLASDCDGHFEAFESSCARRPAAELMGRPGLRPLRRSET